VLTTPRDIHEKATDQRRDFMPPAVVRLIFASEQLG
jgi:hypothetical protein